jgi:hypothetical protein
MGKELAKKAGTAAFETTVLSLLPTLQDTLRAVRDDIHHLDIKLDQLKQEMYDRFEQTRDVINELGQRIARVEGKLEGFINAIERQSDKMDKWIERVMKVEMLQGTRRRKAS